MVEALEDAVASVELADDGTLIYRYHRGAVVDLEAAKRVVALAAQLTDHQPAPAMVFIGDIAKMTRDARVFFGGSDENESLSTRVALIARSPVAKVLANFFLGLNKPRVPVRMFTDDTEARKWLWSDGAGA